MLFSTFCVAEPQGTCFAQTTTVSPGLARSAKVLMPFGLPLATAMASLLVANTAGRPSITPLWVALVMVVSSAEANTSALAPLSSFCTSAEEPS